jgi:putative transposase
MIERWFLTLKSECLWLQKFGTLEEARREIDQFINAYNRERPHRALGMLAPSHGWKDLRLKWFAKWGSSHMDIEML